MSEGDFGEIVEWASLENKGQCAWDLDLALNAAGIIDPEEYDVIALNLKACDEPPPDPKTFIIVMDVSTSMADSRGVPQLPAETTDAICSVIDGLSEEDAIGMAVFSSEARETVPIARATRRAKNGCRCVLACEPLRGGTNIEHALDVGLTIAAELPQDAPRECHVLFVTDGYATRGEKRTAALVDKFAEKLETTRSVNRSTFVTFMGIGLYHDPELLMALANAGDTNYIHLPTVSVETVQAALRRCPRLLGAWSATVTFFPDTCDIHDCLSSDPFARLQCKNNVVEMCPRALTCGSVVTLLALVPHGSDPVERAEISVSGFSVAHAADAKFSYGLPAGGPGQIDGEHFTVIRNMLRNMRYAIMDNQTQMHLLVLEAGKVLAEKHAANDPRLAELRAILSDTQRCIRTPNTIAPQTHFNHCISSTY